MVYKEKMCRRLQYIIKIIFIAIIYKVFLEKKMNYTLIKSVVYIICVFMNFFFNSIVVKNYTNVTGIYL